MKKIHAAQAWPSNAEMILDLHRLGIIRQTDLVLDPTYGEGVWWQQFLPDMLIAHDLYTLDGVDFQHLPEPSDLVDVVAFDPPYMAPGGRTTSRVKDFYGAYGSLTTPATPAALQCMINWGLNECARVCKPGGFVLVKCMNYVSSGHTWPGVYQTHKHAIQRLGLKFFDEWVHVGSPGPQPTKRFKRVNGVLVASTQVHALHNSSTLLIFKKPRRRH